MTTWGDITFKGLDFTKLAGKVLVQNYFEAKGYNKAADLLLHQRLPHRLPIRSYEETSTPKRR
jgi:hypothetical protein